MAWIQRNRINLFFAGIKNNFKEYKMNFKPFSKRNFCKLKDLTSEILKENENLKNEIKNLKKQLEENQNRCTELQDINQHINHELDAYKNAENKRCKKGDYCKNCAFGHKRSDYIRFDVFNAASIKSADYYVCEFDCCKNFVRKENKDVVL